MDVDAEVFGMALVRVTAAGPGGMLDELCEMLPSVGQRGTGSCGSAEWRCVR
jgi:hypothetical protein